MNVPSPCLLCRQDPCLCLRNHMNLNIKIMNTDKRFTIQLVSETFWELYQVDFETVAEAIESNRGIPMAHQQLSIEGEIFQPGASLGSCAPLLWMGSDLDMMLFVLG